MAKLFNHDNDIDREFENVYSEIRSSIIPKYSEDERDDLSPEAGVLVYNTTTNKLNFYNGSAWEVVTSA
jgi:hypothetical protein